MECPDALERVFRVARRRGQTPRLHRHVVEQTMDMVDDVGDDDRPSSEDGVVAVED